MSFNYKDGFPFSFKILNFKNGIYDIKILSLPQVTQLLFVKQGDYVYSCCRLEYGFRFPKNLYILRLLKKDEIERLKELIDYTSNIVDMSSIIKENLFFVDSNAEGSIRANMLELFYYLKDKYSLHKKNI